MGLNERNFQKLTPIHNTDMNVYEEALDFVFENEDVKNVAISGAYSAGKSSMIETYKKTHSNKVFLHISLAHFESTNDLDKEKKGQAGNFNEENVLEGKILNQLIHQIDAKKIPQTNFRVKRTVSKAQSGVQAISILLLCIILLYGYNFNEWKTFVESLVRLKPFLLWTAKPSTLMIVFGIGVILLGGFIYGVIQIQKNKNIFKKISVNGNEIEIFEQSNDSYFDKYLNEVIYLFEKSGADVVVFEDMDRYNSNRIFQRLREVNVLVNNRRCKWKDKKTLRFFYLLRDDIFVSKDRTKFFDFIIPVVPILDGSNSYDQFIAHFKVGGIFELFEESFLQGISLYVDDMRILKNIYNEFVIYNARIGTTEQNANKLLAMIVYKNLFPRDFSDLQLNRGFVFSLFDAKEQFIEEKKATLQGKIEAHKSRILKIENEALQSAKEIDLVYTNPPYIDIYRRTMTEYVSERDLRKENLKLRENGGVEKIKADIQKIEEQITKLENLKLHEIIDRDNVESIFKTVSTNEIGKINAYNEIKESDYFDLLKFLIRNGFIDETYPDYMTYFYENSLSRIDKMFLRSISDQKAKEYTYELKNPQLVLNRLRIVDFENEEILNFDLISYLLSKKSIYAEQLGRFISQLRNSKKYDFIIQFIESKQENELLLQVINRQWPQFFECILNESNYSQSQKKVVAQLSLYVSTTEELSIVDETNILSNYISCQRDFLDIQEPKQEIIIEKLKFLQVKFSDLNIEISNEELWSEAYVNNLYELNWQMIGNILEYEYKLLKDGAYNNRNLTLILSNQQEPLALYVKENMNEYFEVMLANCAEEISDSEDVVVFVLNDNILNEKYKKDYLNILTTKVSSLNGIKDFNWWSQLMNNDLLLYSEENLLRYFFENDAQYDNTLIRFINKFATTFTIDDDVVDEKYGEKSVSKFFTATVKCNELKNDKYRLILHSMNRYYSSFSFENIDEDKIEILIELGVIRMTSDVLLFMREHYPNQVLSFIVKNSKEYAVNVISNDNFILEELMDILEAPIEEKYKIALLGYTDESITIQKMKYEDSVKAYILHNNFDENDLCYLLQNYDDLNSDVQISAESVVKNHIEDICSGEYSITFTLLLKILFDKTIPRPKRMELFSFSVKTLHIEECKKCLEALGDSLYLGIFEGKRPKVKISDTNKRILDVFKHKGWISKYEIYKENYYRAVGRRSLSRNEMSVELL